MNGILSAPYLTLACLVLIILFLQPALAEVKVNIQLADQLPPLAHDNQEYNWQFVENTFTSSDNNQLDYLVDGLPSWATFDATERRITGKPSKQSTNDESSTVTVTAKSGEEQASSKFDLILIKAPAPSLKVSLKDQLPKAASMGSNNMLPDKVLHIPLGWSFSIGFSGDTFVLPEDDRVYYSTYMKGAQPLPEWLVWNEDDITYTGVAPVDVGPNGKYFDITMFASNRANSGGPSSTFTIFVGSGITTYKNLTELPIANATAGGYLQYQLPNATLYVDGKPARGGGFNVSLGSQAPTWLSYDAASRNITGHVPFSDVSDVTNTTVPIKYSLKDSKESNMNLTLSVYPSPFKSERLPNVTLSTGKDFSVDLRDYLRDSKAPVDVFINSSMNRRALHRHIFSHQRVRRGMPSWVHYDEDSKKLMGTAPDEEQQLQVHLRSGSPVENGYLPQVTSSFPITVKKTMSQPTQKSDSDQHGLSSGEKGAIAGSILGAAVLATLALALCWWLRRKRHFATQPTKESTNSTDMHSEKNEPNGNYDQDQFIRYEPNGVSTEAAASERFTGIFPHESESLTSHQVAPTSATSDEPYAGAAASSASTRVVHPTQELGRQSPQWRKDDHVIVTPFLAQSTWKPPPWAFTSNEQASTFDTSKPASFSQRSENEPNTPVPETSDQQHSSDSKPGKAFGYSIVGLLGGSTAATEFGIENGASSDGAKEPKQTSLMAGLFGTREQEKDVEAAASLPVQKQSIEDAKVAEPTIDEVPAGLGMSLSEVPPSTSNASRASWEEDLWYPTEQQEGAAHATVQRVEPALSEPNKATLPSELSLKSMAGDPARSSVTVTPDVRSSEDGGSSEMFTARIHQSNSDHEHQSAPTRASTAPLGTSAFYQKFRQESNVAGSKAPSAESSAPQLATQVGTMSMSPVEVNEQQSSLPPVKNAASLFVESDNFAKELAPRQESLNTPFSQKWEKESAILKSYPLQYEWQSSNNRSSQLPENGSISPFTVENAGRSVHGHTREVVSHTPKLENVPQHARSWSQFAKPQELVGAFDDAENDPVFDPFADSEYPYGTVLYQEHRPRSTALSATSSANEQLEQYITTEGGLASLLGLGEDDFRSRPPSNIELASHVPFNSEDMVTTATMPRFETSTRLPPRSGTMASIELAQARSVNFTSAKPPRLQLASCRPGEAISLPLMSSQVSFPNALLESTWTESPQAQYVPQLFAPTRPDLHQKWPTWLSWLTWYNETQELAGIVPRDFAKTHELPMQLPIHILLESQERPSIESNSSTSTLLVARILLTILPAAGGRILPTL